MNTNKQLNKGNNVKKAIAIRREEEKKLKKERIQLQDEEKKLRKPKNGEGREDNEILDD